MKRQEVRDANNLKEPSEELDRDIDGRFRSKSSTRVIESVKAALTC